MAKAIETTGKPRGKVLSGKDGVPFSKDYQPTPEAKKRGGRNYGRSDTLPNQL